MGFTESERRIIDEAYRKMSIGEPLDKEELDLLLKFERMQAVNDAKAQAEIEQIRKHGEEMRKQNAETARIAREAVKMRRDKAKAAYKRSCENVQI